MPTSTDRACSNESGLPIVAGEMPKQPLEVADPAPPLTGHHEDEDAEAGADVCSRATI
jgi:hypothetical protein